MVTDNQQKDMILAAHFAAANLSDSTKDFEGFVHWIHSEGKYDQFKHWWDDLDALRTIRAAEHIRSRTTETERPLDPIENPVVGQNGIVQLTGKPIGKIYSYYRTVLPQEMQIKIAYDSLIERFMEFLQREKCAIRLSENQLAVTLFIPMTNFHLEDEWQKFIQFAYSEEELYKSFVLFVNSMKLTDRGFGYVHFPSVTEGMKLWQAAFYIATLEERVVRYPDNYRKAKANKDREVAGKENRKKLKQLLTELRYELQTSVQGSVESDKVVRFFDKALRLSRRFNQTGKIQFSYGTVKPRANKGKIEDKIIEILSEQVRPLDCPLASVDVIEQDHVHSAGDTTKSRCYSCGRLLPPRSETRHFKGKLESNRFVFSDPSQRLQSGSGQVQPSICLDCLAVTFGCSIKLVDGAIIVRLSSPDAENELVSTKKYLQMLTLGELNLIAGQYLLIKCNDYVGSTPVSEKIGPVQYTHWRVAQTLPTTVLEKMKFILFVGESEIPLPSRHLVWLSYLYESFSPRVIVNRKDNIPLCQAIRLIQKDEVISAIYKLVTAEPSESKPLKDWSYSEKRSLEELREKHCTLLEQSSKGDKLMSKQADLYRDVAALTGLTYAYCDYVRGELRKKENSSTVQREVKKLIEKVVNPSFFNYEASKALPGTRATMYCSDDNYFCYTEAKRLLEDTLKINLSDRQDRTDKGQESLAIFFDDILNAYAALSHKYDNKAKQRKLSYQLKLNLHAKFASLLNQKGD